MQEFIAMLSLLGQLFIMIFVGYLAKKSGVLSDQARSGISNLLINLILPANIINSFLQNIEVSSSMFLNCLLAILISTMIELAAVFLSPILYRKYPKEQYPSLAYGTMVSNSSFMGIPVIESLYGSIGVVYTSIFQIPLRLTMWTIGLKQFDHKEKKKFVSLLLHPCILAVLIGVTLLLTGIKLPSIIQIPLTAFSKCTTPLSMLVIGAIMADIDPRNIFDKEILKYAFIRLIGFPLVVYLALRFLPIDRMILTIAVLLTGMPTGSTTAILADKYNCDSPFAAKMIFVTALLSIITIPLLSLLLTF